MKQGEKRYWLDDPRNVDKVYYALLVVCALSAISDFFYVKQGHFAWEGWFNFHGWYGFICCFLLVLAAKQLRRVLMRKEDYYD